uniref:Uncharacterized protein n=1 Tax=Glossina pallidipes TaxID=7398 RepID=A0A1B0A0S0_GLOPL
MLPTNTTDCVQPLSAEGRLMKYPINYTNILTERKEKPKTDAVNLNYSHVRDCLHILDRLAGNFDRHSGGACITGAPTMPAGCEPTPVPTATTLACTAATNTVAIRSHIKQRTPPRSKLSKALASKSEISMHCLFSEMRNSSSSESILKSLKKPNQASSCNSLHIPSSISSSSSSFSSSADDTSLASSCNVCNLLFKLRNEVVTVDGLVFPRSYGDAFSQNYRTAINAAAKKKVLNKLKVNVQKIIL